MVRLPTRHTLIKCDVRLNASQNHFRTQIINRCLGFNDELHSQGQHSDEWLIFHHQHLNMEIVCAFLIFNSFRRLDRPPFAFVLQWPHPASLEQLGCFLLFLHWPLWAHSSPHYIHKHVETQICIIQQKVKTADVDKRSRSTVNVLRVLVYLCAYTCTLCMNAHAPCTYMNVFRFEKLCGCAQVSTRSLCILQMQIRKHLLESFLPAIPTYSSFAKHYAIKAQL